MGSMGHIHRGATTVLSMAMLVIGAALIVQALSGHGGLISLRPLLGLLFIAAGLGRLYVEARRRRPAGPAGSEPAPRRSAR